MVLLEARGVMLDFTESSILPRMPRLHVFQLNMYKMLGIKTNNSRINFF